MYRFVSFTEGVILSKGFCKMGEILADLFASVLVSGGCDRFIIKGSDFDVIKAFEPIFRQSVFDSSVIAL
jgi:hypothetical protein